MAQRNAGIRPALPSTFVKIERNLFPTLAGPCSRANVTLRVPSRRYPNIRTALDSARPFTRITVAAGEYIPTDPSWYPSLIWVRVDNICITGAGSSRTFITAPSYIEQAPRGIMISSDNVAISGMTVRGFLMGVYMANPDGSTQRNITLTDLNIIGWSTPERWSGGIHAIPDYRTTKRIVLDGLLLSNVNVSEVIMGVSCDYGPCAHWWLDNVRINCRGGEGWGADAFAMESGRQVVMTGISVVNSGSDGIDIKASEVVVSKCSVLNAGANGLKLWTGGDVMDCVINGTGNWLGALSGADFGRFRYRNVVVTRHSRDGRAWLGHWGDFRSPPRARVEMYNCTFRGNPNSGGFAFIENSTIWLENNEFWDLNTRLLAYGDPSNGRYLAVDANGIAEITRRGWGRNNRLGGV
eukprot:gene1740-2081_t